MKKLLLSSIAITLLSTSLFSKECVAIKSVAIGWTSYKTMAKIGVSGTFKNVKLTTSKEHSNIQNALVGTSVQLNMANIDAKAAIKTTNILKFFAPKLASQAIDAKIVKVSEKSLDLAITLNGKTKIVPMSYTLDGGVMLAKGVIDARDFTMSDALKNLNSNVAGHKNKGWLDIAINFELIYEDSCR